MSTFVIHTKGDGHLGDTSPAELAQITAQISAAERATIHIHGGLVNKSLGVAAAHRLSGFYTAAGVLPVFPVWESGLFETVGNNWKEIFYEKLFQALLKRLLKHAGGKLLQSEGGRATATYAPLTDREAAQALKDARSAIENRQRPEPLGDLAPVEPPTELTAAEERQFATELAQSMEFREAVDSVMLGLQVPPLPGSRAPAIPTGPASTHLSPAIRDELAAAAQSGARSLFSTAVLVKHAAAILANIVRRFAQQRDHGFYTTVVEELLRQLYFEAAGGWVWGKMKKQTDDAFNENGARPPGGGALFLHHLATQLRTRMAGSHPLPRISLVAHSAGSLWACHFLRNFVALRDAGTMPTAFRIDRVTFLAPACTYALFSQTLARHAVVPLFNDFRMFALGDSLESGYWEAPPLYPRSLLYLVSGLFEDEADRPLLGMERFFKKAAIYKGGDVQAVRAFLSLPSERAVWSREDRGPGLVSDALKHGDFDSVDATYSTKTMQSVAKFLTT